MCGTDMCEPELPAESDVGLSECWLTGIATAAGGFLRAVIFSHFGMAGIGETHGDERQSSCNEGNKE